MCSKSAPSLCSTTVAPPSHHPSLIWITILYSAAVVVLLKYRSGSVAPLLQGLQWLSGKEQCRSRRRHRFDPWIGKIPWIPLLEEGMATHSSSLAWYGVYVCVYVCELCCCGMCVCVHKLCCCGMCVFVCVCELCCYGVYVCVCVCVWVWALLLWDVGVCVGFCRQEYWSW